MPRVVNACYSVFVSCHATTSRLLLMNISASHCMSPLCQNLIHLFDESIDVLLSVTKVTTLDEVLELSGSEPASRVAQLERPQEVGCLLEVGTNGVDLMNQILHADNAVLAQVVLNQLVISQRDSLLVDLAVSSLVDQLSDGLEVWVAIGDVRVDDSQHFLCGLGKPDEDTVVDLEKSKELENLSWLRGNLVDTLDSDNEDEFGLLFDIEAAALSGDAG